LEQGWERSWIYYREMKKWEPSVVAGYIEPAWLENGFETELGTFKFEVG